MVPITATSPVISLYPKFKLGLSLDIFRYIMFNQANQNVVKAPRHDKQRSREVILSSMLPIFFHFHYNIFKTQHHMT